MAVHIDQRIRELPVTVEHGEDRVAMVLDLPAGTTGPAGVWEHLTDPELLATWSPVVPDRPLTSAGPALSREHPEDEPVAADVLAVDPGRALAHRWGEDVVEWTVNDTAPTPQLTVTMRLAAPEYAPMYLAGWQVCLAVLVARLEGEDQQRIVGHDAMDHGWEELRSRYASQLGLPDTQLD